MTLSHVTRRKLLGLVLGASAASQAFAQSQTSKTAWEELTPLAKAPEALPDGTQTFTTEQLSEFIRCMNDPTYFIENYVNYSTWQGVKSFPLQPWQHSVIQNWKTKRGVIGVLPRQSGKTALQVGMMLHSLMFSGSNTSTVGFMAPKHTQAVTVMQQVQFAYDRLPEWMKVKTSQRSKAYFELENGNRIIAMSFNSSAMRGRAFSDVYIDEIAFMNSKHFEEFWVSVYPTISSGSRTRIMMLSTPNGKNHFHATYLRNSMREDWYAFQVNQHQIQAMRNKFRYLSDVLDEKAYRQEYQAEFLDK